MGKSDLVDQRENAMNLIWTQLSQLQNWSSSSWWFFLLLPEQESGFGPKQMMFSFASRAGERLRVNNNAQPGFELNREIGEIDQFMTTVVGWIFDGKNMHDNMFDIPVYASLDRRGELKGWSLQEDGSKYGASVIRSKEKNYGLDAKFVGPKGSAEFSIWNASSNAYELPTINTFKGPLKGRLLTTHLIAWRKFNFSGTFDYNNTTETMQGIGYFQRVCMNIPLFPWKWVWIVFKDQSIFSLFIPYLGLQLMRTKDRYFHPMLEKMTVPLTGSSYFIEGKTSKETKFSKTEMIPVVADGSRIDNENPTFYIKSSSPCGDQMQLIIKAHGHTQFILEKRFIFNKFQSKYNYNEYMVKVVKISGKIDGVELNATEMGNGWGNTEYTWGLSL